MRPFSKAIAVGVAAATMPLVAATSAIEAQSLLDRPDNISTDWVGNTGTLYFNFVHRFSVSPPPERKVSNFPTFLIATGIASQGLVGVNYATNSSLAARYPNEWEFFGRYAPLQQEAGALFDLGAQLDYNLAVKGVDGELSIAHREGPVRLVAVSRMIADTLHGNNTRFAYGGGGTIRLGRFIALAGDAASLAKRQNGEEIAWSAGLHIALPNTPHSLSLHISNAGTSTLQGFARGGNTKRYGFEFTIPVHMGRFFSSPEPAPVAPVAGAEAAPQDSASVVAPPKPAAANPPVTSAPPAGTPPTSPPTPQPQPPVTPAPAPTPTPTRPAPADTTTKPQPNRAAPPAAASRPAPAPSTQRAPAPAPAAHKVVTARMKGQAFIPTNMEIDAGTTVTWKNLDALIHTVTAVDKSFSSGSIGADGTYSHTFTKPGTYPIYCLAHPFMKATIVVK